MLVKYVLSDGISQAFLPFIKAAVEMQNNLPSCD
jgi:hypothetical protein